MLSSVRLSGTTECMVFEGAVDKRVFSVYMEEVLLPQLKDNDIVIMDNLSVHKDREMIPFFRQVTAIS